jgi:hypothetical protein
MKRILFILTSLITLNSSATDCQQLITTAKNYVDTYIVPNGNNTITGTRANAAFNYIITALKCVDTIQDLSFTRNSSRDSFVIVYKGVRFAVKDSIGSGGSGTVTSIATDLTLTGGTITTTGTLKVDTSVISTLSALKDSIDNLRNVSVVTDTTLYTVINSLNTPPVSPNAGDVYLVGNSPTGAWVGHAKDIATWDGSAWTFIDGVQGNFLYNASTGITYIFRGGNWVQIGGIPALNNGNTISSGLTIGTNNLRSLEFETNNSKRGRFDSIGRLHVYNLPISTDTFINVTDINGKFGKVGKTSFAKSIGIPINTIDVTYTQLYDLYSNSQLVPLAYYKITDFQTIYNQTGTGDLKTSSVEELIVQASGTTTLFPNAISAEFPTDEIVYDITYTNTYITSDSAKGKIIFRKNLNGVSAPFDFRKVLMYDARSTSENLFYQNPDVSDIASDIASYPAAMSSFFSVEFPASSIGGITSQTSNNFYYDTRISGDLNQSSNNVFVNNSFTNVDQVSSSIFFESSFADDVIQMTNMQIEDCEVTGSTDYCTSSSWSNTTFGENVNAVLASNFSNSSVGDRIGGLIGSTILTSNIGKRLFWCNSITIFNSNIDGNAQGLNQHTLTYDTINCNIQDITGITMFNSEFGFSNCKIDGNSISSTFGNITVQTLVLSKRINETDYPILFNQSVHKTIYKKPNGSIWFYYIDDTNTFIYTEIL